MAAPPPSKPDGRISRIRLSGQWVLLQGGARSSRGPHGCPSDVRFLAKSIALDGFHHRLALAGTRVGLSSGILSFIRPPSCPPWLHGHYSLRSYYGDSDSCPSPSCTRTGLLDYRVCISRHSVSNHPMRPRLPAMLLVPGGLGLRFALCRYRRFFGLRTLLAVSSVA